MTDIDISALDPQQLAQYVNSQALISARIGAVQQQIKAQTDALKAYATDAQTYATQAADDLAKVATQQLNSVKLRVDQTLKMIQEMTKLDASVATE